MNSEELEERVLQYGGRDKFLKALKEKGIKLSEKKYLKSLCQKRQFLLGELVAMIELLNLNPNEVNGIFFCDFY